MAAWREPPKPVPAYVRRRQRRQYIAGLLFAILFVVVLMLAHGAANALAAVQLPQLNAAAAELAGGGPVTIDCQNHWESEADPYGQNIAGRPPIWGYSYPAARHVVISSLACGELMLVALDPADERATALNGPDTTRLEGWALFDLAHELGHVVNGPNEAAADCYALANLTRLAGLLGVASGRAAILLGFGRQLHDAAPPAYHDGCP